MGAARVSSVDGASGASFATVNRRAVPMGSRSVKAPLVRREGDVRESYAQEREGERAVAQQHKHGDAEEVEREEDDEADDGQRAGQRARQRRTPQPVDRREDDGDHDGLDAWRDQAI